MMIAYIVTEGSLDEKLLKQLLPEDLLRDVGIVAAGGLSDGISMARSLAVKRQVPLLMIVDADSVEPRLIGERRSEIKNIVAGVAVSAVEVILAVPQLEAVLFHDRTLLTQWFGDRITQEDLIRAEFQPRQVLERLLAESPNAVSLETMIEQLTDRQVESLRQATVIQEAMQFLRSVQPRVEVA
jgi:hypothetical protein